VSFAARLIHELTHVATPEGPTRDDYGQPDAGTPVTTAVKGLVQPKSAREIADSRSSGAALGDHVVFLEPMTLSEADHFLYGTDRLEIVGIRRYEFGRTPHLEVDARRITPSPVEEGS
jgi:hypothetical protein